MWSILLRIVIGILLIIHGVAHWTLPTGWDTSSSENTWLLGSLGLSASAIQGTARGLIRPLQPEKRSNPSQQMGPFATLAET